ncbi:MAG: molybdopterin-dependent oxidoreductase [Gammaproteobacteria bacterium]|nr:molybdopterin-dependent oxidoreductase [Gammaproteobacteria bacterium]MDH4253703.1 molybdopterin-dependent oxidoreductase [Gammaproteobacteria bacterium]
MGKWSRRAFVSTGLLAGGVLVVGVAIRPGNRAGKVAALIADDGVTVLNVWLKIAPDNTVTAIVPHAEMGQGVHTTLAMMLADEMDADWSLVRMQEAPAHPEYANYALAKGYALGDADFPAWLIDTIDGVFLAATKAIKLQITGGSTSVPTTGMLGMRVAGAAARAMLLQAASDAWQVPVAELRSENSLIVHEASGRSAPFADFAVAAADVSLPPKPRLKDPHQFRIMGTSPPRLDIPAKTDGSARFGIDADVPGMKYATIRAAPVFGSSVVAVDEAVVQDMPGLRKIVNLGDAVAVIADGYWQAKQVLDRLPVEFAPTDHDTTEQGDIFSHFAAVLDAANARDGNKVDFARGDATAALNESAKVIEAEYRVPYLAHAPMEPMNCTAWLHDGKCELWLGTQNPLGFAAEVGDAIGLGVEEVIVHNQYLGGGFGRRAFPDFAIQAGRIAAEVPYPVKLIWSREEDMRHDHYRQASISRFRAALDSGGNPVAWVNQYVDKHDPVEAPHIPYAIGNQLIHYTESRTHVPWGFWRSVDHSLHAFFTESFIDELAHVAGEDPYQFRRKLLQNEPRYRDVLDLAAEKADWSRALPAGWGRGIAIHRSFGTIVANVVEVEVSDGGLRAHRVVCTVDCGFAMHPDGLVAQMESGIVFGLTAALYGEISIRRGAVAQGNFHDYPMLRIDETPTIETHIINGGGRVGGAGEPGTPAIAPALANAIFAATGQRIRELPIRKHDLQRHELESRDTA